MHISIILYYFKQTYHVITLYILFQYTHLDKLTRNKAVS